MASKKKVLYEMKEHTKLIRNWYVRLFQKVTIVVKSFILAVNQSNEIGVSEIRIYFAKQQRRLPELQHLIKNRAVAVIRRDQIFLV